MKNNILRTLVLLVVIGIFTACSTTKEHTTTTYTNEIKSDVIALNTYFDKEDYLILGTVEGESDFVWYNAKDNIYEADSGKYGYISEPTTINVGNNVVIGTGKTTATNTGEEEIVRRARLNANYILIEKAYAMGGDSILDPIYTVVIYNTNESETVIRKAKVKVRAKVIQLKTE